MNRRNFLSLTAASIAAMTLKASGQDAAPEPQVGVSSCLASAEEELFSCRLFGEDHPICRFDDACTAMSFLKFSQDPDDYKWVKAGMRPLCEPRKHAGWYARAYAFLPEKPTKYPRRWRETNLEECRPTMLNYNYHLDLRERWRCHVVVPWVEVLGKSPREVNLAKQKMLVDLLDASTSARFGSGDGEHWWKVEVFRDHVAGADHRLKSMGFPNIRQILMPCRKLSPLGAISTSSKAVDMLVEALEVIHICSNSPAAVMGCEACPENTMFITAGAEQLGSFEQCSYVVDGKYISHVNMAILNDYAVTKIKF